MQKMWWMIAAVFLTCAVAVQAQTKADGAAVYQKCFGCHKNTGVGIPGIFPPLAGTTAKLVSAERAYPVQVLLYGLKGEILVKGEKYNGTMPAFGDRLNDEEIAAVLNHVLSSWGNPELLPKGHKAYSADEVRALRGKKLSPDKVYEARKKLKLE